MDPLLHNAPPFLSACSDTELVALARVGEGAAREALYQRYRAAVDRRILSRLPRDAAEDAAAETWARALGALDRYREEGHFAAWVLRIAENVTTDVRRRRLRETRADEVALREVRDPGPTAEEALLEQAHTDEVREAVRSALAALREERPAWWAAVQLGLTEQRSPLTALERKHAERGRRWLRRRLLREHPELFGPREGARAGGGEESKDLPRRRPRDYGRAA